ncbi:Piso0_000891 [Millerozyma farinosa CBS 7064]|uniref:Piso0_000891 protein n=1 Tax=Pichia sorbitophila (strain ATCC MYA-4447 / BCRC 22081 / CBS 7064 / NBRC 10061 / NRRL Y-12695) TaxID=559304 RepID=G8YQC4_PICSO|nr:Piso0_000891 [Millerozyma farinosa CBS 7064]
MQTRLLIGKLAHPSGGSKWVSPRLSKIGCQNIASRGYATTITQELEVNASNTPPYKTNHEISQDKLTYLKQFRDTFPNDQVTNSHIEKYISLCKDSEPSGIEIGIFYDDAYQTKPSRLVESVLADPLSDHNSSWFEELESRDRRTVNLFSFGNYSNKATNYSNYRSYKIPSPMLSEVYRPTFMKQDRNKILNMALKELNGRDLESHACSCQFLIYVTDDISKSTQSLPKFLKDNTMLTVVDNEDYTPSSSENSDDSFSQTKDIESRIMKVNSNLSYFGIKKLLDQGTSAGSLYFESLQNSNIYSFWKFLGRFSTKDSLKEWQLKKIITNISNSQSSQSDIDELYKSITSTTLPSFSNSMHSELQNIFIPDTNQFFSHKLQWWKLYLKNDNVEYELKDLFSESFMNSSIENYNFIRGRTLSEVRKEKYAEYPSETLYNPLQELKNRVINQKIGNEIQPVVYVAIISAFFYYQLPISVLSFLSYYYFEFSFNSATALALLGWVVGFNYISKVWDKFTRDWLKSLYEDVRVCLGKECIDELMKELKGRYRLEQQLALQKQQILDAIKKQ